jgi:cyclic-di-GMP phosphodiesterase TipF (flagellum assembly factor)
MARMSAAFIAACMGLVAGALGVVAHLAFGFSSAQSTIVAFAALAGLALFNLLTTRDRVNPAGELADLSSATADLAKRVGELTERIAGAEETAKRARSASETTAGDLAALDARVTEFADTVSAHEAALFGAGIAAPKARGVAEATGLETKPHDAAAETVDAMEAEAMRAMVAAAVEANRIDLYLQPIVTLPQRKVRYYEALARLRTEAGEVLPAHAFLAHAETAGLLPKIDQLLAFRCVRLLRQLTSNTPDIGLFCNVSATTLREPEAFAQFLAFLRANRVIAPSLILEFRQSVLRGLTAAELERLAKLADLGFRFSMDQVADLELVPGELAGRSVRYIKVPASLLLDRTSTTGPVRPTDLSELLSRLGIDLIAEKIEREETVVELIDFDVRFGQGFLFSPPRAVRADAIGATPPTDPPGDTPLASDGSDASAARARARAELALAAAALKPK